MTEKEHGTLVQDQEKALISTTEISKFSENKLTSNLSRRSIVSTYCSSTTTSYSFTKVSKSSTHSKQVTGFRNDKEQHEIQSPNLDNIDWVFSNNEEPDNLGNKKSIYVEELPIEREPNPMKKEKKSPLEIETQEKENHSDGISEGKEIVGSLPIPYNQGPHEISDEKEIVSEPISVTQNTMLVEAFVR